MLFGKEPPKCGKKGFENAEAARKERGRARESPVNVTWESVGGPLRVNHLQKRPAPTGLVGTDFASMEIIAAILMMALKLEIRKERTN
jgi:hypothetical protein